MLRTFQRSIVAAVTTAATVFSALGVAPTVQADALTGPLVLGEHQDLGGAQWSYTGSETRLGSASDRASSVKNRDSVAWVLYDDTNHGDRHYCLRATGYIPNLHDSRWNFGDKISSVKRLGSNSCRGYPTF
ncbi:peptidase inhibitor family I36 protein [Streptomyces niveus]